MKSSSLTWSVLKTLPSTVVDMSTACFRSFTHVRDCHNTWEFKRFPVEKIHELYLYFICATKNDAIWLLITTKTFILFGKCLWKWVPRCLHVKDWFGRKMCCLDNQINAPKWPFIKTAYRFNNIGCLFDAAKNIAIHIVFDSKYRWYNMYRISDPGPGSTPHILLLCQFNLDSPIPDACKELRLIWWLTFDLVWKIFLVSPLHDLVPFLNMECWSGCFVYLWGTNKVSMGLSFSVLMGVNFGYWWG